MTPIDQLIVTLGLDSKPFVAGVDQAIKKWKGASAQFKKQTATVSASSKQAAVGMEALRVGVAGLAAIFGFALTKELLDWNKRMTEAGSSTFRFANRIGATVGTVNQLRGAVRIAGGTFEDADASLTGITSALQKWQLLGEATPAPFLRAFNVDLAQFDPNKAEDMIRLTNALAKGAVNLKPGQVNTLLGGLFPAGYIDFILKGPAKVKELLVYTEQYADAHVKAAKNARETDEIIGKMETVSSAIDSTIYEWFAPARIAAAKALLGIVESIADFIGTKKGSMSLEENFWNAVDPQGTFRDFFKTGKLGHEMPPEHGTPWPTIPNVRTPNLSGGSLKGLPIKSAESTAGGNVNPATVEFARALYAAFPDIVFTGFNDLFHQRFPGNDPHKQGRAFDVALTDPARTAEVVHWIQMNAPVGTRIKNEYTDPSERSTGKHIHVTVNNFGYSAKDADKLSGATVTGITKAWPLGGPQ